MHLNNVHMSWFIRNGAKFGGGFVLGVVANAMYLASNSLFGGKALDHVDSSKVKMANGLAITGASFATWGMVFKGDAIKGVFQIVQGMFFTKPKDSAMFTKNDDILLRSMFAVKYGTLALPVIIGAGLGYRSSARFFKPVNENAIVMGEQPADDLLNQFKQQKL